MVVAVNTWDPIMGDIDYEHERLCKDVYFIPVHRLPTLNQVPWIFTVHPRSPSNHATWWWR